MRLIDNGYGYGMAAAIGLFTSVAPAQLCDADNLYGAGARYDVGRGPQSVALGDLDGDGVLDMVVANRNSDDASVLMGHGDGTFSVAVSYDAGNGPRGVSLGDLDGDGDLDIAVANKFSDDTSVLLGNGDGTFGAAVSYALGSDPYSLALGDLDGDGDLDMAVARFGSTTPGVDDGDMSVLLGNGDGTFSAAVSYAVGVNPIDVSLGDLDGDGDLDMAVAVLNSSEMSVLLNTGDGTFSAAVSYVAGSRPQSVTLGDLDGDGVLDMAVANVGSGPDGVDGGTSVLLGNGDGTFGAAVSYAVRASGVRTWPWSMELGDLDGDGDLDIIVADGHNSTATMLPGNGTGMFTGLSFYGAGFRPFDIALGDLDGDGDLDMVVANEDHDEASVLLNQRVPCSMVDFACPGGVLNFADVTAFVTAFSNGGADVDLDGSGSVNFGDVTAFLNAYAAGCP